MLNFIITCTFVFRVNLRASLARFILIRFSAVSGSCEDDTRGPILIKEPPNRVDFSNTTGAKVECSARGNPPPEIIWVRSDGTAVGDVPGLRQVQWSPLGSKNRIFFHYWTPERQQKNKKSVQVLPSGSLVFPPFRAEDYRQEVHAQVYVCLAKNSVGSIHSRDVNVRAGKKLN